MIFSKFATQQDERRFVRISGFLPLRVVKRLRVEGRAVIAEFNRDEVLKRPGSSSEYQESAETNVSLGLFLGYSTMPLIEALLLCDRVFTYDDVDNIFTPEHPLYISEGGHRSRWTDHCDDSDAPIGISFLVGDDVDAVVTKVKGEYGTVNTKSLALNAGELERIIEDPERNRACATLYDHMTTFCPATKTTRETRRMNANAVVNTLTTGDFSMLHTKKSTVVDTRATAVTPDNTMFVEEVVGELDRAMNDLVTRIPAELPEPVELTDAREAFRAARGEAKAAAREVVDRQKAAFKDAQRIHRALRKQLGKIAFDLDLYGPLLFGLYTAHAAGDITTATETIMRWFDRCAESVEEWTNQFALVTRATSTARSYNEARYRGGWETLVAAANAV